ncbi:MULTISPECIES: small acid-soluble spore protein SspI [Paenibacillus]|uniref:small acid-soluble spore protein SspI n=1 Tax=Paenibacillus TaxID=44249 RepID=UPI0003A85357|nr:small acid-soluble spore protein SspI [Paenibacillus massiliensis]
MPITLDLRQAIVHKVHGESEQGLTEMIEGSVDGPEAALPGLGAVFEMIWKDINPSQRQELVQILHHHLQGVQPPKLS